MSSTATAQLLWHKRKRKPPRVVVMTMMTTMTNGKHRLLLLRLLVLFRVAMAHKETYMGVALALVHALVDAVAVDVGVAVPYSLFRSIVLYCRYWIIYGSLEFIFYNFLCMGEVLVKRNCVKC